MSIIYVSSPWPLLFRRTNMCNCRLNNVHFHQSMLRYDSSDMKETTNIDPILARIRMILSKRVKGFSFFLLFCFLRSRISLMAQQEIRCKRIISPSFKLRSLTTFFGMVTRTDVPRELKCDTAIILFPIPVNPAFCINYFLQKKSLF